MGFVFIAKPIFLIITFENLPGDVNKISDCPTCKRANNERVPKAYK
jgi:hypothetical protein